MGKRYWWLKLPEDFFRQIEIKKLRKIAGGDTYTIIYLKMMLLSLKNEGQIAYDCSESEFVENLALDIDEDEENVALTVAFLRKYSLIIESEGLTNEISLPKAAAAIGSETAAASRMRAMRERQKNSESVTMLQDGYGTVTDALRRDRDRYRDRDISISSSPYNPPSEQNEKKADDDDWKNICILWNGNISPLVPLISEKLKALYDEVGYAPLEQGITKAVERGARNFAYIQAVARNIAAGNARPQNGDAGFSGNDLIESLYGKDE